MVQVYFNSAVNGKSSYLDHTSTTKSVACKNS